MNNRYKNRRRDRTRSTLGSLDTITSRLATTYGSDICEAITQRPLCDINISSSSGGRSEAYISIDEPSLRTHINDIKDDIMSDLPTAIHPSAGELDDIRSIRKYKQVHAIISRAMIEINLLQLRDQKIVIADFGAGSGHVALALAYICPYATVYLCERKEYSINVAMKRIIECGLENVIIHSNCLSIESDLHFNIGVSLHSCGQLTDIALSLCYKNKASFVLSPCCYGQIARPSPDFLTCTYNEYIQFHFSNHISRCIFNSEDKNDTFELICSSADISVSDFEEILSLVTPSTAPLSEYRLAKTCMRIVDLDRLLRLCETGKYVCFLSSMFPIDCSPKNNCISGRSIG